jgi:hypothetical protein
VLRRDSSIKRTSPPLAMVTRNYEVPGEPRCTHMTSPNVPSPRVRVEPTPPACAANVQFGPGWARILSCRLELPHVPWLTLGRLNCIRNRTNANRVHRILRRHSEWRRQPEGCVHLSKFPIPQLACLRRSWHIPGIGARYSKGKGTRAQTPPALSKMANLLNGFSPSPRLVVGITWPARRVTADG